MKRSSFSQVAFTLILAAVCAFGLSLTLSQPAQAALACPSLACSSSAMMTNIACNYLDLASNCTFRCQVGMEPVPGPLTPSCYGNCAWEYPL